MSKFRVIVAGSRGFNDYQLLENELDRLLAHKPEIVIISGTARGADQLGERYAEERGYPVEKYPADWDKYGKSAGYKRNQVMADNADALVAFWDGNSRGTQHMVNIARDAELNVRVIKF